VLRDNSREDQGPSIPRALARADLLPPEDLADREDGQVLANAPDLERRVPDLADHGPEPAVHLRRLKPAARSALPHVDAPVANSSIPRPRKAR